MSPHLLTVHGLRSKGSRPSSSQTSGTAICPLLSAPPEHCAGHTDEHGPAHLTSSYFQGSILFPKFKNSFYKLLATLLLQCVS